MWDKPGEAQGRRNGSVADIDHLQNERGAVFAPFGAYIQRVSGAPDLALYQERLVVGGNHRVT